MRGERPGAGVGAMPPTSRRAVHALGPFRVPVGVTVGALLVLLFAPALAVVGVRLVPQSRLVCRPEESFVMCSRGGLAEVAVPRDVTIGYVRRVRHSGRSRRTCFDVRVAQGRETVLEISCASRGAELESELRAALALEPGAPPVAIRVRSPLDTWGLLALAAALAAAGGYFGVWPLWRSRTRYAIVVDPRGFLQVRTTRPFGRTALASFPVGPEHRVGVEIGPLVRGLREPGWRLVLRASAGETGTAITQFQVGREHEFVADAVNADLAQLPLAPAPAAAPRPAPAPAPTPGGTYDRDLPRL